MRHTKDSIDRYFDYDLHLESRTLWLGSVHVDMETESGTDASMAERAVKALHLLSQGPKAHEPILIQMNNLGGSWYHGMAVYDAIRACPAHVRIEASGFCMSMGSCILQAGDERILTPNARVMIHDGHEGFAGHARNFEAWGHESKRIRQEMYRLYAERSGQPVGYWAKRCIIDYILTAQQAVQEGLADSIKQPTKSFNAVKVKAKPKKKRRKA